MRLAILIICLAISSSLSAKDKYKFKKITKEMLEQSAHPIDSEAEAAYLYNGYFGTFDYSENDGGFIYKYEVSQRIKLYNESGKDQGDFTIFLYRSKTGKHEDLLDLDAYTYSLDNGKIKSVKLNKSDIYKEEVNDYYTSVKFALPDVQAGSILEVRYKIESPFYFRISEYYLQKSVPVDQAIYEIRIPEYYSYNPLVKGLVAYESKTGTSIGSITYSYVESNTAKLRSKKTERMEYKLNTTTYTAQDVPAMVSEDYVHNINNYRSSIAYELQYTQFPNSEIKTYSSTWDAVAANLKSRSNFGAELNTFKKEAKQILNQISSKDEEAIAREIYQYINTNYSWNKINSLLGSGARKFLKEGRGNCADINLLLAATLQEAGLSAFPVVCKTRSEGYLNVSYPVIADLNYVFVLLETEKGSIYLDATTKSMPFGAIPSRADNLNGVAIADSKGIKIDISNPNVSQKLEYVQLSLEDGSLSGEKTIKHSKMSNFHARNMIATMESKDDFIASINNSDPDALVSQCQYENFEDPNKDLVCKLEIDYSNYIQTIEDKVFIPLTLDQGFTENPFRAEDRKFNIFFDYKMNNRSSIIVKIPEGYKLESVPEPKSFALPGRAMIFSLSTAQMPDGYAVTITLKRNVTAMTATGYQDLKSFYDEVVKACNNNIVLVKS